MKEEWNDVLSRCDHSVFSTWDWLTCWWKHYGTGKKLFLLLAEEDNQIVGIAPLMYSVYGMLGARMGMIEFIGTPNTDYCDFILLQKAQECVEHFVNHLIGNSKKWNCIDLKDIPGNSKGLSCLPKRSRNLGRLHECPYMFLPESYEKFLTNLSRNQRKNIYRTSRRIEEAFNVEFIDYSVSQSLQEGMQCLFDLHQKRWESLGFKGNFSIAEHRAFNLDIANLFSKKGWLCLFVLNLSGKPAAVAYGFKYQSRFYEYVTGMDPVLAKYNVGNLLRAHMVEMLIQDKTGKFDFMRGAEEYKDRWNTLTRWNYEAIITRKGFLENARYQLYDIYWRQAERLKYIVKNAPRTLARAINKYS